MEIRDLFQRGIDFLTKITLLLYSFKVLPVTRKEKDKDKLKKLILKTVLEVAAEEGWNHVTIRKISNKVEYSTIVIYNLFGSKEKLFHELKDTGFKKLNGVYQRIITDSHNPQNALMALSNATLNFYLENKELYQIMFGVIGLKGVSADCKDGSYAAVAQNLVENLLHQLFNDNPKILFMNWWAINQGFISMIENSKKEELVTIKEAFEASVQRFLGV